MKNTSANKATLLRILELQKAPFYSGGAKNDQDRKDYKEYNELQQKVNIPWMANPDWLTTSKSPYEPNKTLPAKGTKVLFITCDQVKDKKAMFGFKLVNYRIEEGTFNGMFVRKDNGSDFCRPQLSVKVISGQYEHRLSCDTVVIA